MANPSGLLVIISPWEGTLYRQKLHIFGGLITINYFRILNYLVLVSFPTHNFGTSAMTLLLITGNQNV
jgi:hypothetical protein